MAGTHRGKFTKAEETEKRHRKKKLISDVRIQLEFYFSPANLQKDIFMQELLAEKPYIELEVFNTFNKIKNLSTEPKIIRKAVETSTLLEFSENKLGIKRKIPFQSKENEIDCTIYIEEIPATADHEWVKNTFSRYGGIDYISLPKFKETGNAKGFAFVEFQTEAQAKKAINAFGGATSFGAEVKSDDLRTVQTFLKTDSEVSELARKRSLSDEAVDQGQARKKVKQESEDKSESGKKKKKRKRKNKDKEDEAEGPFLKVMSKRQWKSLRNEYLDKMRMNKRLAQDYINSTGESSFASRNQKHFSALSSDDVAKMPVFVAGVVVKFKVETVPQDKKVYKDTLTEENSGVAYIDINIIYKEIHIRFKTSEDAAAFLAKSEDHSLLSGDEESAYWEKVYSSWMLGRNKKNKKNKEGDPMIGPKFQNIHFS